MADPILESSLKTRLNTMCCDIFYCKIKKFRNFSCASKQLQVCFPLTIFQPIDLYRTSFEIFDSQIRHELHKIGRRDRKISIGKIGQTAWQNRSDMTKIGSATVRVNGGLVLTYIIFVLTMFQVTFFKLFPIFIVCLAYTVFFEYPAKLLKQS